MTADDVSVIMPVYNGAAHLAEAISSVLSQRRPPHELLVVDDGSVDSTPAIMSSFGDRIVQLRQENRGPSAARNLGISRATGRLIAFLDADDLWPPAALDDQLGALAREPHADVAWGLSDRFCEAGQHASEDWHGRPQWALAVGSMLFRRGILEDVEGFDEGLRAGEDMDLLVRLRERKAVIFRHDAVVHIRRIHGRNLSRDETEMIRAHYRVVGRALARRRLHSQGPKVHPQ